MLDLGINEALELPLGGPRCEDFRERILQIVPTGRREIHVEILQSTWDWKAFFEPLTVSCKGLTITEQEECVSHGFRFMRRSDMSEYKGAAPQLL